MIRVVTRRLFGLGVAGALSGAVPRAGASEFPPRSNGDVRLVVVHWKVKPGREAEFLGYWSTRAAIEDRAGLICEFLCSVEDRGRFPWITSRALDPRWTSFFNVGLWRDTAAFQDQIGRHIDDARPSLDFEAERRERVFLSPERWRLGRSALPASDAPGVL